MLEMGSRPGIGKRPVEGIRTKSQEVRFSEAARKGHFSSLRIFFSK